jgi:hypothetical protein
MIPEGRYKARGVEGVLARTSSGREQLAVLIEITDGEYAGHQYTWYAHFTDKTIERDFESLRHLGWETDDLTDLRGIDANEVSITIEHETDQHGEARARIRWINKPGGIAIKDRMDDGAAKAFAQRMRGYAAASRQRDGAPQQQRQQQSAPSRQTVPGRQPPSGNSGFGGDDIPFDAASARTGPRAEVNRLFWSHVFKTPDGCWKWTASVGSHGYGNAFDGRKVRTAHRWSFEIHFGPVPDGMFVLHRCDDKRCVRPEHLYAGTHQQNMDDTVRRARHRSRWKLTPEQAREIRASAEPSRAIARRLGVAQKTIQLIRRGLSHRELSE